MSCTIPTSIEYILVKFTDVCVHSIYLPLLAFRNNVHC